MKKQSTATRAAIDIGSNSTELIVARCTSNQLNIIEDTSKMVRLGESVKATGDISPDKRDEELTILHQLHDQAKQGGAELILAVATEATREAHNKDAFVEDVQREIGLQVNVLSGITEAALTFHGATYGSGIPAGAGVLDVGGGSTELVTARQKRITWLASLPIGSGWLHDQFFSTNPPTQNEVEQARDFLRSYLSALNIPQAPQMLVVTGSSAKKLLKLGQQALNLDTQKDRMTHADLSACLALLLSLSAEDIARRYDQEIERARVLPGGALLILQVMEMLHLNEIRVTNHGLSEGVLLAYSRYGENWLDHPEVKLDEARIGQAPPLPKGITRSDPETLAQFGQKELPKRVKKFLEWSDEVLKNEDTEDVHKMRVASRRLRATLDAYEPISKRKPFKKAYRKVQEAADLLGTARDTDVMIQNMQEQLAQAPSEEKAGIQWLIDQLSTYRKQRQQELEAFFQGFDADILKNNITSSIPKGGPSDGKS